MHSTATLIVKRARLRALNIETVGDPRREPKQIPHDRLPLAAMRFKASPLGQMKDQPVGHLMRNHLVEKRLAIIGQQHRIEAQSAPTKVCLPRLCAL